MLCLIGYRPSFEGVVWGELNGGVGLQRINRDRLGGF